MIATGTGHCDGPEVAPGGEWIYFNTESFASQAGHAQIARIRVDGTGFERLTQSPTVDWFPHISPNGHWANYLRYPPGTLDHPADVPVEIITMNLNDWTKPLHVWPLVVAREALTSTAGPQTRHASPTLHTQQSDPPCLTALPYLVDRHHPTR